MKTHRTTIDLPEDLHRILQAITATSKNTKKSIIIEAVRQYIEPMKKDALDEINRFLTKKAE